MNWYSIFYWMSVADKVSGYLLCISIVTGILGFIALLSAILGDSDYTKTFKRWMIGMWCISFVLGIGHAFTPSKKDMLLIVAGGAVGTFITSDSSARAIPADLAKYVHMGLQEQINDLSADTRKELGVDTPEDRLKEKVKSFSKEELLEYLDSAKIKIREE